MPLVVAPTTVTDSKGRYVDGLTPEDLILYDNNVPQMIRMDWMMYPIDLVVAVQTSSNSGAVIDKLGGTGILFTQLLAADAGATAVISFSNEVKMHQDLAARQFSQEICGNAGDQRDGVSVWVLRREAFGWTGPQTTRW